MRLRDAAQLVGCLAALVAFAVVGVSAWWLLREIVTVIAAVFLIIITGGG